MAEFRKRHGPPAATIEAIYSERDYHREGGHNGRARPGKGYYIDTFADLPNDDAG